MSSPRKVATSVLLGAGLALLLSLPQALNARRLVSAAVELCFAGNKAVVTAADFEYLGAMRVPGQGWPSDPTFSYAPLTARKVDGVLHFFSTGSNAAVPRDAVYEFMDTGSYDQNYRTAPRAALVRSWGDIYQGKRTGYDASGQVQPLEYLTTTGLLWANGRLYWNYFDSYNVTYRNDPSIGFTDLGTGPESMRAYGPWRVSAGPKHSSNWLVAMPDGTMGIGATLQSGHAASSWGPELLGIVPPSAGTPVGPDVTALPVNRTYVQYQFMGNTLAANGTIPSGAVLKSLRRPGNYVWHPPNPPLYLNPSLNGGGGSFTDADYVQGSVFVDLPDKHGLIFAGSLATGHVWYGPYSDCGHGLANPCGGGTGPNSTGHEARWWIYDPSDLAAVDAGLRNPWLQPAAEFDPSAAIFPIKLGCTRRFGGMYFDAETRRLYVATYQADDSVPGEYFPLIHVFRIR